jgi:hypothetical protein
MKFLIIFLFIGVLISCNTEEKKQPAVSVKTDNGIIITVNDRYRLFDDGRDFRVGERVAIELVANTHEPSALRHATDVIEYDNQTYVATTWSGKYKADVIYAEVIKQ